MPFITIKSLPFEDDIDVPNIIKHITEDFAVTTDIGIEHVTVIWEFIPARHYSVAGLMPASQPRDASHPVLVEMYVPSFHKKESLDAMLESLAFSISKRSGISHSNIYIHYNKVFSGEIFAQGKIIKW